MPDDGGPDGEAIEEGRAEDYADRDGYDADFLGDAIALPDVRDDGDVLRFEVDGRSPSRAQVRALQRRDVEEPEAVPLQRGQPGRRAVHEEEAPRLAPRPAHPARPADRRRLLRQRAALLARTHDPARGPGVGHLRVPRRAATPTPCT